MKLRYTLTESELDSILKLTMSNKLYVKSFKGGNKKRIVRNVIRDCASNKLIVKSEGIIFEDLDFFMPFNNCKSMIINDDIIIAFFNIGTPIYIPFRVFENDKDREYLISKFENGVKMEANLYAEDFVKSDKMIIKTLVTKEFYKRSKKDLHLYNYFGVLQVLLAVIMIILVYMSFEINAHIIAFDYIGEISNYKFGFYSITILSILILYFTAPKDKLISNRELQDRFILETRLDDYNLTCIEGDKKILYSISKIAKFDIDEFGYSIHYKDNFGYKILALNHQTMYDGDKKLFEEKMSKIVKRNNMKFVAVYMQKCRKYRYIILNSITTLLSIIFVLSVFFGEDMIRIFAEKRYSDITRKSQEYKEQKNNEKHLESVYSNLNKIRKEN